VMVVVPEVLKILTTIMHVRKSNCTVPKRESFASFKRYGSSACSTGRG
jgi:hypothetical protein